MRTESARLGEDNASWPATFNSRIASARSASRSIWLFAKLAWPLSRVISTDLILMNAPSPFELNVASATRHSGIDACKSPLSVSALTSPPYAICRSEYRPVSAG